MTKEELKEIIKNKKQIVSKRLAAIESLLDRMAYSPRGASDSDGSRDLYEESDELEQKMDMLRSYERELNNVDSLDEEIRILKSKEEILETKSRIEELSIKKEEILLKLEANVNVMIRK